MIMHEYGVKDSQGRVRWFCTGSSAISLGEAIYCFDSSDEDDVVLMERLVTKGRKVDRVRFYP